MIAIRHQEAIQGLLQVKIILIEVILKVGHLLHQEVLIHLVHHQVDQVVQVPVHQEVRQEVLEEAVPDNKIKALKYEE